MTQVAYKESVAWRVVGGLGVRPWSALARRSIRARALGANSTIILRGGRTGAVSRG